MVVEKGTNTEPLYGENISMNSDSIEIYSSLRLNGTFYFGIKIFKVGLGTGKTAVTFRRLLQMSTLKLEFRF